MEIKETHLFMRDIGLSCGGMWHFMGLVFMSHVGPKRHDFAMKKKRI